MMYECYPVDAAYVVASPTWWGFRGTSVRAGDRFDGLVGPEADRVYLNTRTPRPMEVLSHSSYSCRGTTTSTESVYYTTKSGPASSARGRCVGAVRSWTGASTRSRRAPASSCAG